MIVQLQIQPYLVGFQIPVTRIPDPVNGAAVAGGLRKARWGTQVALLSEPDNAFWKNYVAHYIMLTITVGSTNCRLSGNGLQIDDLTVKKSIHSLTNITGTDVLADFDMVARSTLALLRRLSPHVQYHQL